MDLLEGFTLGSFSQELGSLDVAGCGLRNHSVYDAARLDGVIRLKNR